MKEKGTVYDGMLCIELMEIDARDRTYVYLRRCWIYRGKRGEGEGGVEND